MDRPLQDVLKVQCFGCGSLNAHGLQIKSRWLDQELVCRWRPEPFHIGYPGTVYGGTIASIVDCHSMWTAIAEHCRDVGHDLENGAPPFAYVTGKLTVNYLKPIPIDGEIALHAKVVKKGERTAVVVCRVMHDGVECATSEVVAVRVAASYA
jgi:acyl-coenzyme A thioesterase PaaI-like protein